MKSTRMSLTRITLCNTPSELMLERDYTISVRCTLGEHRLLRELAEAYGLSISDVVRQLIRRDHEARLGPKGR